MTLPLTPARLAATYEFLRAFPPFSAWRLPPSDGVRFQVLTTRNFIAQCTAGDPPLLQVSRGKVGHAYPLLVAVAHEMVHMRQAQRGHSMAHNAEFHRLARLVCRRFGFDPKAF